MLASPRSGSARRTRTLKCFHLPKAQWPLSRQGQFRFRLRCPQHSTHNAMRDPGLFDDRLRHFACPINKCAFDTRHSANLPQDLRYLVTKDFGLIAKDLDHNLRNISQIRDVVIKVLAMSPSPS